jgi:hypothetical protein
MLLTLLPQSRESKSRTWGTLFQLSPSAGLGLPSSPPTTWFVTYKIFTIECIIWRMYSSPANTNHCIYVWNFLKKYWAKFWLNPCLPLQCPRYFCLLVLFNPQKQYSTFVTHIRKSMTKKISYIVFSGYCFYKAKFDTSSPDRNHLTSLRYIIISLTYDSSTSNGGLFEGSC